MFNWIKEKVHDFWTDKDALKKVGWGLAISGGVAGMLGALCSHQESSLAVKDEAVSIVANLVKKNDE